MILFAVENNEQWFTHTPAFAIGIIVGAIITWLITQRLNISTIQKNKAEIRDKTRQLQESLDERETIHRNADAECGKHFARLKELIASDADSREIATTRDLFCTCLNTIVIPAFAQLVRRRILYYRANRREISDIVAGATKEIRDWQEYLGLINDPKLLQLAEQSANTISKHDLNELRQCVVEIADDTAEKAVFLKSLNDLIGSGTIHE